MQNYSFYCSKDTVHYELKAADIFSYLVSVQTGIGIARSKWLWNNKKFFKSHGIDCKCETLGHMSHFEFLFNEFKAKIIRWIRIQSTLTVHLRHTITTGVTITILIARTSSV